MTKDGMRFCDISPIIAFDMDGVVADSMRAVVNHIRRDFGYRLEMPCRYRLEVPGVPYKFLAQYYKTILIKHQDAVQPYPEANDILAKIVLRTRKPIHFLTARSPDSLPATNRWIIRNLPDIRAYRIILRCSRDKADWLIQNNVLFFVEDRLRTANEVAEAGRLLRVFLVNRPWNVGRATHLKVTRVADLREVYNYLFDKDDGLWPLLIRQY